MSFYKRKIDIESAGLAQHFSVYEHEREEKRCKNPVHYNEFIRYTALINMQQGLGATYLYIHCDDDTEEERIAGYITLRATSLIRNDLGTSHKHGFPALEIAELAIDKNYASQKIGTEMVLDAINIANEVNEMISIKYIVLCAGPAAVSFYKKNPLLFREIQDWYENIPREQGNTECIPMYLKLR